MANTTTAVLNALRYTYGADRVLYLFNQESVLFNILGKVKKPVGGRGQFIMPIMKQNPGAFTGISEGGSLPTALDAATTEATFGLQEYVAVYTLSWKLIQDSRTDKFAFQQAVQMLDDGLQYRVMRNLNADLLDDGRGRLGIETGGASSNVSTCSSLPLAEVGMVVDLMSHSDNQTKRGTALVVTGVDPVARTITTTGTIASDAAGDYFVIKNTTDASVPAFLHAYGILGVVSDSNPAKGNFGGLDRTTAGNEFWKSVVKGNSGTNRALTEDILLEAMDNCREKNGGMLDAWISDLAITRRYHDIIRADTFFALSKPGVVSGGIGREGAGEKAKDGKTPYEFSGIPWHVDPYFHANTIVGLDTKHFFLGVGENDAPRPISEIFDNVPFFKVTSNATFDVNWYYQMQLLSDNPGAGVQIQDIAES